jgi:hypothetical protein
MPTRLIKKYIEEFAKFIRNQQDYDDFEYGTEVIPGDKTWVKPRECDKCRSCSCRIKHKDENRQLNVSDKDAAC